MTMNSFVATTADEIAREDIINRIDRNLFIEAGAGSGKTTMLVNRMVAMVEAGIEVDKISAITFTKNAAREFYQRFQAKLIERSNPDYIYPGKKRAGDLGEPDDATRSRCLKALENIDLCFMGTIDSFCNVILSEHPSEANIPSDAKLIDDDEATAIYRQFYIDALDGKYGKELKRKARQFAVFFWNGEEVFSEYMKEIMDRRNIEFLRGPEIKEGIEPYFRKDREDMIKALDAFDRDLSKLSLNKDLDHEQMIEEYRKSSATIRRGWQYNFKGVEIALKSLLGLIYEASPEELGFTSESVIRGEQGNTVTVLNIADEETVGALMPKMREYKYSKTMDFMLESIPYLEKEMHDAGKFTFFDYLYYLRQMLKKDAEAEGKLIRYIYERHSYFLIDEFQDTNPMQAEIFFYLTAEDPHKPSWRQCRPKGGSLFIVGDPKQSIYRFRSADVSSYIEIKKLFKDEVGEVRYLNNNFRSRTVLKQYFNDVFNEVMPETTINQSKYQDIENLDDDKESEFEGLYTYETFSSKVDPSMTDNERIAAIIKALVDNPDHQIIETDKNKENFGKLRNIAYRDFMVIFSSKSKIAPCIETFKREQIPSRVEGKILFEQCEGLKLIANLYRTISNVDDAIALISTLHGPLFSFGDSDLVSYRKKGNEIRIEIGRDYGDSPIEKALNRLSSSAIKANVNTPSSLYESLMDEYEIFRYVTSENLEIVYYVLELLRGKEKDGSIISNTDAVEFMDTLLSGESEIERCLSLKDNIDAVHLANLHKVKGLEAPIVILGKAGNSNRKSDMRIEYHGSENGTASQGYVLGFYKTSDNATYSLIETARYRDKADEEKESLKSENDRLVYVAATRARNALIINKAMQMGRSGKPQKSANKWKALRDKVDNDIFEIVKEKENVTVPGKSVNASSLYRDDELRKIASVSTYERRSPSTIKSISNFNEEAFESDGTKETSGDTYSTLIGTMMHRLMEMIVMSKDRLAKEDIITNIMSEYMKPEFKEYEETFIDRMNRVYDVMHSGGFDQKGDIRKDILPVLLEAEEKYAEVPFTYRDGDTLWNGIVDMLYRGNDGLHIIDWKTNRNDEGLDEHYAMQLEAYIKACERLTGEKVIDAKIYHLDIS